MTVSYDSLLLAPEALGNSLRLPQRAKRSLFDRFLEALAAEENNLALPDGVEVVTPPQDNPLPEWQLIRVDGFAFLFRLLRPDEVSRPSTSAAAKYLIAGIITIEDYVSGRARSPDQPTGSP